MFIDLRTPETKDSQRRSNIFMWIGAGVIGALAVLNFGMVFFGDSLFFKKISEEEAIIYQTIQSSWENTFREPESGGVWQFVPEKFSMETIKKKGCVADGFLSGYGERPEATAKLIDRSNCEYLHRALETWLSPPDFKGAREIMQQVKKRPVVYGMFLAEAISTKKDYSDPDNDHNYRFSQMCRDGTEDRWTSDSCIPDIEKPEYRRYLKSITHRAIDQGIQSFLFGQVYLQDKNPSFDETQIKLVLDDMRKYAKKKDIQIIIGAQTGAITDEKYLRLFDYIEGGVGIDDVGQVENGPCWSQLSSCWALLWHERYSSKANDVLLHLDWSGLTWDDMGKFARMDRETRAKTMEKLYRKFTGNDMGFLLPMLAVLHKENEGCYGPNKSFYSPDNKYRCKDEDTINRILSGGQNVLGKKD